ncbi:uncharacterized protein LOC120920567 isoform X2 [Rana temporaria]|uniref:uncharacterized protein LOC120920567 isoform X2 n=1 Tax=Rana temporaria TaxID=8407 RepID=UPI001AADBD2B|nr:uncharacterized protein LOC120920567 isoform X2 [Rana temporaria]
MRLLNFLLFSEVVVSQMVLYNPQNIVMADVGATAVISCVSNATIEDGTLISWYKTSSKPAKSPKRVKACQNDNDAHKYGCKNSAYKANLEIYNVQIIDSGVYFCAYHYVTLLRFSNGTALIIRDGSKEDFTTSCKSYLGFVLCGGLLLLLVLTVHLFWQYKQIDKKAQDVTHQDRDSDGIVYAHLDMSRLTQGRKQQR